MKLQDNYYNYAFSHIYVEKEIGRHPRTQQILKQFPNSHIVWIDHYKDVFCRRGQNSHRQVNARSLILAQKTGNLIYDGAKVCQSFGNEYFYYTSCVMNCLYDCEYCYLKGMYPSSHIVVFVNLEDIFEEVENILQKHPAYICVSYDTDLMALEKITGFVKEWVNFCKKYDNLKIEIRTKCGRLDLWENLEYNKNVIFAFTISPKYVTERCEHYTASLSERLHSAAMALERGFSVRLCFDPMIYCPDWKLHYAEMMQEVVEKINLSELVDVSVGSFRISQDYLKKMRRNDMTSQIVQFPYQNIGGVYQYPLDILQEMEQTMIKYLTKYIPQEKIFQWE